jgi:hypothetical protein
MVDEIGCEPDSLRKRIKKTLNLSRGKDEIKQTENG